MISFPRHFPFLTLLWIWPHSHIFVCIHNNIQIGKKINSGFLLLSSCSLPPSFLHTSAQCRPHGCVTSSALVHQPHSLLLPSPLHSPSFSSSGCATCVPPSTIWDHIRVGTRNSRNSLLVTMRWNTSTCLPACLSVVPLSLYDWLVRWYLCLKIPGTTVTRGEESDTRKSHSEVVLVCPGYDWSIQV